MIRDSDIKLHIPDPVPYDWAETGYFNFYIPEANIFGFVYIVHRAGIGATISDIEIVDRAGFSTDDAVYIDLINHNPLVAKAENFQLATGLSFRAKSIREYEIEYAAGGVELKLDCVSLMEPYDIHDPAMDPMAVSHGAADASSTGFGEAYSAHFDMTVRVRGSLALGDKRYAIDAGKIQRELGWTPQESFETGMRKTVQWYLDRADWWRPLQARYAGERLGLKPAKPALATRSLSILFANNPKHREPPHDLS